MPFKYYFGGLAITSQLRLARLRPGRPGDRIFGQVEITVEQGLAPGEDERLFDWPGRFVMKLGRSGSQWRIIASSSVLLIDQGGTRIRLYADDPDETILKELIVRRLLPRLVKLHGAAAYHAASLEKNGQGILLMGKSGAGKSTMTAGLGLVADWSILGDDMALVWQDGGDVIVPAGADIAVWLESANGLQLSDDACSGLPGYEGKVSFQPGEAARQACMQAPISGIFFLCRSQACDTPVVTRVSRQAAFRHALTHGVLFNPNGAAGAERVATVTHLNEMLKRVPAWELTYPSRFSEFGNISQTLLAALQA